MTRDDIIRMARESDATVFLAPYYIATLERFAEFVAAAEREACAEIADEYEYQLVAGSCARDIRARGDA